LVLYNFVINFWFSSATNRLISAEDHAAVQINVAHVDAAGHYNGEFTTFALSGVLRKEVPIPFVTTLALLSFLNEAPHKAPPIDVLFEPFLFILKNIFG